MPRRRHSCLLTEMNVPGQGLQRSSPERRLPRQGGSACGRPALPSAVCNLLCVSVCICASTHCSTLEEAENRARKGDERKT